MRWIPHLFFSSLLAHEVSPAVVAKHNAIGVQRITFWLFGGASELEGDALSPGVDFRLAVVGPVTPWALCRPAISFITCSYACCSPGPSDSRGLSPRS